MYFAGKLVPSKHLWVGNISIDIKRRELEYVFSRHGQVKTLTYANGDPTAIITYNDIEDATKARAALIGTLKVVSGRVFRDESNASPSSRGGT